MTDRPAGRTEVDAEAGASTCALVVSCTVRLGCEAMGRTEPAEDVSAIVPEMQVPH